jgi:hypothetical protein
MYPLKTIYHWNIMSDRYKYIYMTLHIVIRALTSYLLLSPLEHKTAGVKYLINRLITYHITEHNKVAEVKTAEQMLKVNNYGDLNVQDQIKWAQRRSVPPIKHYINNRNKWATFTYTAKETKSITKLFKDQNINIAYSTKNTLGKHLGPKRPKKEAFEKGGVYNIKCQSCPGNYTGQTG